MAKPLVKLLRVTCLPSCRPPLAAWVSPISELPARGVVEASCNPIMLGIWAKVTKSYIR